MIQTVYFSKPDVNAGYLNTKDGGTYCHSVFRMFHPKRFRVSDKEMSIEDFLKICPLGKEKIESILADGKYLINRYEDIYDGKKTGTESWIWGHMLMEDNEEVEMKALDGNWYEGLTHEAYLKWYNETFKLKTATK